MDFTETFNNKLLEFLNELKTTYPDIKEFEMYNGLVLGSIMVDKSIPQKIFNKSVYIPYGSYIETEDEGFLLNADFSGHGFDIETGFVNMIKSIWMRLDQENKEILWLYMKLLIAINKQIEEKNI